MSKETMDTVNWKVEGMTCSNCALTIGKYLEKQGLSDVRVNLAGGDISFSNAPGIPNLQIQKGIGALGYKVVGDAHTKKDHSASVNKYLLYLLVCLPFTLLLMSHMLVHIHWLMNSWAQLVLCIPVYITGMSFFGRSALMSVRNGLPNMNVLITLGATAAFGYSLAGTVFNLGPGYLFYETAAAILTLVFLGNYLEDLSIRSTQKALNGLARSQQVTANMIAFDEHHQEIIFPVESDQLRSGDLILIKTGEQVPADCKILWGDASVNESILTGESLPLAKHAKDLLVGGSMLEDGIVKAQVTAASKDSVLSNIINLVHQAQGEKPPVQQLADRISAVFVPIVLGIALLTFAGNWIFLHDLTASLMRSIAVLVIACPCAMGLATPAAIAVGLGRAARNGILFRNAKSLESFKNIKQVVFDKTGTLTTGDFRIDRFEIIKGRDIDEDGFKKVVISLEKYSNHPIARSVSKEWKRKDEIKWKKIEEIKGLGIRGTSMDGDVYEAGSYAMISSIDADDSHNVYVVKNGELLGWIDVGDEPRPEAKAVLEWFRSHRIRTILLSGDRLSKCRQLAELLPIDEIIAEQTPRQKLEKIASLNGIAPTAMVGDGINDAPSLAKATVGISVSDASHIAMQTADVVLMNNGLKNLPLALGLGKHTFQTIKENLFWAFIYNIIAIPVAAFGLLNPVFGALVMGLSDVVLALNSLRLFIKKVD